MNKFAFLSKKSFVSKYFDKEIPGLKSFSASDPQNPRAHLPAFRAI
jgi:hypothetical protein